MKEQTLLTIIWIALIPIGVFIAWYTYAVITVIRLKKQLDNERKAIHNKVEDNSVDLLHPYCF
jgi:hypothetical protein